MRPARAPGISSPPSASISRLIDVVALLPLPLLLHTTTAREGRNCLRGWAAPSPRCWARCCSCII